MHTTLIKINPSNVPEIKAFARVKNFSIERCSNGWWQLQTNNPFEMSKVLNQINYIIAEGNRQPFNWTLWSANLNKEI